jgi:uncharacterized protein (TIGR03118 family)
MRMKSLCNRRSLVRALVAGALLAAGGATASADEARAKGFHVEKLSADRAGQADHHDKNLVNPWGLARTAEGPWWVANNGTNTISILGAEGQRAHFAVQLPDGPSGMVAYGGGSLMIDVGTTKKPARFLVAAEDGTISAWAPGLDQKPLTTTAVQSSRTVGLGGTVSDLLADKIEYATVVVDDGDEGAVYKGLAIAETKSGPRLYATDFHNGHVNMYDEKFADVDISGSFTDPVIPAGFAPFGIKNINDRIFVTYAKQDRQAMDDVQARGNGYVDEFDLDGKLIARIGQQGELNSPWGLAIAPADYAGFAGDLLVGQFGSGKILAYNLKTFQFDGVLKNAKGNPITIDGLWSIEFGNGKQAGHRDWLYFTAGPKDEAHGLFGYLERNAEGS